jgi:hypothetical protein
MIGACRLAGFLLGDGLQIAQLVSPETPIDRFIHDT